MATNVIQKVKGARDFYPEQMAFRKWLYAKMQAVSEAYGYQEFDGPEVERMELYTEKTSEEIVRQQAFTLQDRDGRMLALRPELTPTFARMVAQKAGELTYPIRWQSFGRAWRYEQPQKGRGREFFQWEVNMLGPETPEADAEILAMAADLLRSLGLTADEVVIRVNDRSFLEGIFLDIGVSKPKFAPLLRVIDRKEKVTEPEFAAALRGEGLTNQQVESLTTRLTQADYSASSWLAQLFAALSDYPGVTDYVRFDPVIVRGFDYYTRTVFEAWDKTGGLRRSLFGGGRFDNLTATLGGKRIPGVGMAPGDMPIEVLLRQFDKMPGLQPQVAAVLIAVFNEPLAAESRRLASELRRAGIAAELWPDSQTKLDKQLTYAAKKGIDYVAIVGPDEVKQRQVMIRSLSSGQQLAVKREAVNKAIIK